MLLRSRLQGRLRGIKLAERLLGMKLIGGANAFFPNMRII
jgi:hypothetical protein